MQIIKELNEDNLKIIKKVIFKDDLVIFPTETVYGIGANALSEKAVERIFAVKERARNNPLIVHLKDKAEIEKYAFIQNEVEKKCPSGTNLDDIKEEFTGLVDLAIDGGSSQIGLESTVVKVIDNVPVILRPGFITKEDIEMITSKCLVSEHVLKQIDSQMKVESPGMLYRHYAPKTKCLLVYSANLDTLKELVTKNILGKTIVLGSSKLKDIPCFKYIFYGNTEEEISHNIFSLLRKCDTYNADLIIIEGVKKEGLGLAIMNRLIRTSNFNYIEK